MQCISIGLDRKTGKSFRDHLRNNSDGNLPVIFVGDNFSDIISNSYFSFIITRLFLSLSLDFNGLDGLDLVSTARTSCVSPAHTYTRVRV